MFEERLSANNITSFLLRLPFKNSRQASNRFSIDMIFSYICINLILSVPPPAKVPAVLFRTKNIYSIWLNLYRKFPKPERFGIGEKIDILFLDILELVFIFKFAKLFEKISYTESIILIIDKLKFFMEVAWENKLISSKQYSEILIKLEEIGKEFGGWRKSLTKTPTFR